MKREWRPGEIGMIDTRGDDAKVVRLSDGDWFAFKSGERLNPYLQPRPLVVIDPEDREAVERLHDTYQRACSDITGGSRTARYDERVDAMRAALREFADPKPPKPEEPKGLGAVVEDAEGNRFIRYGAALAPWIACASNEGMDPDRPYRYWSGIDAVRVLSRGVRA